jgi:hypothetical protein
MTDKTARVDHLVTKILLDCDVRVCQEKLRNLKQESETRHSRFDSTIHTRKSDMSHIANILFPDTENLVRL